MKRSKIRRRSRKQSAREKRRRKFRAAVLARAAGVCDRCERWHGDALHAHHFRPKSLGGTDDPRFPLRICQITGIERWASEQGNGVAVCTTCHTEIHARIGDGAAWIDSLNHSLPTTDPYDKCE
jgi:hypothetical protein